MEFLKHALALSMLPLAISTNVVAQSVPGVHTWHMVRTTSTSSWQGNLQVINERANFVKPDGSTFNLFSIDAENPLKYGFAFDPDDDFDVAYTLTLMEDAKAFVSKTCVFVVTAKGPAKPDINALAYNGASCTYKVVPGVGEDFYVS